MSDTREYLQHLLNKAISNPVAHIVDFKALRELLEVSPTIEHRRNRDQENESNMEQTSSNESDHSKNVSSPVKSPEDLSSPKTRSAIPAAPPQRSLSNASRKSEMSTKSTPASPKSVKPTNVAKDGQNVTIAVNLSKSAICDGKGVNELTFGIKQGQQSKIETKTRPATTTKKETSTESNEKSASKVKSNSVAKNNMPISSKRASAVSNAKSPSAKSNLNDASKKPSKHQGDPLKQEEVINRLDSGDKILLKVDIPEKGVCGNTEKVGIEICKLDEEGEVLCPTTFESDSIQFSNEHGGQRDEASSGSLHEPLAGGGAQQQHIKESADDDMLKVTVNLPKSSICAESGASEFTFSVEETNETDAKLKAKDDSIQHKSPSHARNEPQDDSSTKKAADSVAEEKKKSSYEKPSTKSTNASPSMVKKKSDIRNDTVKASPLSRSSSRSSLKAKDSTIQSKPSSHARDKPGVDSSPKSVTGEKKKSISAKSDSKLTASPSIARGKSDSDSVKASPLSRSSSRSSLATVKSSAKRKDVKTAKSSKKSISTNASGSEAISDSAVDNVKIAVNLSKNVICDGKGVNEFTFEVEPTQSSESDTKNSPSGVTRDDSKGKLLAKRKLESNAKSDGKDKKSINTNEKLASKNRASKKGSGDDSGSDVPISSGKRLGSLGRTTEESSSDREQQPGRKIRKDLRYKRASGRNERNKTPSLRKATTRSQTEKDSKAIRQPLIKRRTEMGLAKQVLKRTIRKKGASFDEMKEKALMQQRSSVPTELLQPLRVRLEKFKQSACLVPLASACPIGIKTMFKDCVCRALRNSNVCICHPAVCLNAKSCSNPKVCYCVKSFTKGRDGETYHTKCYCLEEQTNE